MICLWEELVDMQIQPQQSIKRRESKRARQAARDSDDVFKGGAGVRVGAGRLKSPWHAGIGRLWEAARRKETPTDED